MYMLELVCPAGNLPALKAAVTHGADAVYVGFRDQTNARHFPGLNFSTGKLEEGIQFAKQQGTKVFLALNTYPQGAQITPWLQAIDKAASLNVDALIIADIGLMAYAHQHYPHLPLHLSVQGSATHPQALSFYQETFAVKRAVLPRVLSAKQVAQVVANSPVDIEVFAFGSLCIMAEGRCHLSSYLTGESPNKNGACSPAHHVRWEPQEQHLDVRLNGVLIDRYQPDEPAGYPTLCKGRFQVNQETFHVLEEPTSLNTLSLLPELYQMGVKAVKIEGRQRSPAYVANVVRIWREAIDQLNTNPEKFLVQEQWAQQLCKLSEGVQTTLGAYSRPWQ